MQGCKGDHRLVLQPLPCRLPRFGVFAGHLRLLLHRQVPLTSKRSCPLPVPLSLTNCISSLALTDLQADCLSIRGPGREQGGRESEGALWPLVVVVVESGSPPGLSFDVCWWWRAGLDRLTRHNPRNTDQSQTTLRYHVKPNQTKPGLSNNLSQQPTHIHPKANSGAVWFCHALFLEQLPGSRALVRGEAKSVLCLSLSLYLSLSLPRLLS